jgi:hypothetical protein
VVASPNHHKPRPKLKHDSEAPPFSPTKSEQDSFDEIASNATEDVPAWGDETADKAARRLADHRGQTPHDQPGRATNRSDGTAPSPFMNISQSQSGAEPIPGSYRRQRPSVDSTEVPVKKSPVPTTPVITDPQLTWRDAVQRLNAMGIRNFRLEAGHQPSQFLFYCSYTPRDNARVSYRFEAEADEPLRAVERVLEQIDTWLAAR